ncbi:MAG: hypothetical protein D6791_12470 [Chloroflexi bacterium]|nr:MAG: hypothetical protein D6791_12470 [Chloroflexota bacterium]
MNKELKIWGKRFLLILSVLMIPVGSGWFGDAIGERFNDGLNFFSHDFWAFEIWRWWKFVLGLLLFILGVMIAYWLRREYLPVQVLARAAGERPAQALVLTVSQPNFRFKDGTYSRLELMHGQREVIELSHDLERDCTVPGQWNWQQLLRAIRPHVDRLKRAHLIGSIGRQPGQAGSFESLEDCMALLKKYLPEDCVIEHHKKAVDFEDIDAILMALDKEVRKARRSLSGIKDNDIMLDCTGGQKTASIAVALYTTRHPGLQFQYVDNGGRIQRFNVVAEKEPEVG